MYQCFETQRNNQKHVTGSQIVAKAMVRRNNGQYDMIVVFAASTRLEFFWIFKTRSPRSPRRSWKFEGTAYRDNPLRYHDFASFVQHWAAFHGAEVLYTRMPHKRQLSGLMRKCEHESIYGQWEAREGTQTYDRVLRKIANGRRGKAAWVFGR